MRTVREGTVGKLLLRLVEDNSKRLVGVILADDKIKLRIEGDSADDVWRRLHDEAGKAGPMYFGFDGARARFRQFFPDGFRSPHYVAMERDYKLAAKAMLDESAPIEQAASGSGFGEAVLAVYRATNMLSVFEKQRIKEVLRGPDADAFTRAAAQFAIGESKPGLIGIERVLKRHKCAQWTIATYLPFFWRPEQHMFLKPQATKDFAARVGHRFAHDYHARLDPEVYASLLDLAARTMTEIEALQPRDLIDAQSFIWVVGDTEIYKPPKHPHWP